MDIIRARARERLQHIQFSEGVSTVEIVQVKHATAKISQFAKLKPPMLTSTWSSERLFECLSSSGPAHSNSAIFVVIDQTYKFTLSIDRDLFTRIFDAMGLDPLLIRFLGTWDPVSCQPSSTGVGADMQVNYMRIHGQCVMWTYDMDARRVKGIIMPKSFDSKLYRNFGPHYSFLMMTNLKEHLHANSSLLGESHGFTYICCASILERLSATIADAYASISLVEQGTGHGNWTEQQVFGQDDMTRKSKDIGRVKHVLVVTRRHLDSVKSAFRIAMSASEQSSSESPAIEPFRFLRNDITTLDLELESLLERANNQMSVLFNLIAREETRASIQLADASLKIAEAAKSDSGAMKTVAVMTMLFLPPTFFAALFSMPLLRWGDKDVIHDQFWVYWWYDQWRKSNLQTEC